MTAISARESGVVEITVTSSVDGSVEPSLFLPPASERPAPLLVGLHTWSCDRFNQVERMAPACRERGWSLLLPEFRGPNHARNPRAREACASRVALQDVVDAVEHVCGRHPIARDAILLLGGSGGGHMALMLAAYRPGLWRGVGSWCPITDLAAWHSQNAGYAQHIAACCGGPPGSGEEVERAYEERSPLHHAAAIARARLSVHHGRYDTSVPFTHTLELARRVEALHPHAFFWEIFDGGHELRYERAFAWFDALLRTGGTDRLTG